jgi:hypothetical protein
MTKWDTEMVPSGGIAIPYMVGAWLGVLADTFQKKR